MVSGEDPGRPDQFNKLIDLLKQNLAGSVLDQISALRVEALDTANTALKLAADAELRAASASNTIADGLQKVQDALAGVEKVQQRLIWSHVAMSAVQYEWVRELTLVAAMQTFVSVGEHGQESNKLFPLFESILEKFPGLMIRSFAPQAEGDVSRLVEELEGISREQVETIRNILAPGST